MRVKNSVMAGPWRRKSDCLAIRYARPVQTRASSSRSDGSAASGVRLPSSEEPIRRPRQAEILAQRRALVFAPEQPAALQFRHDLVDEIVEARRADTGTSR